MAPKIRTKYRELHEKIVSRAFSLAMTRFTTIPRPGGGILPMQGGLRILAGFELCSIWPTKYRAAR